MVKELHFRLAQITFQHAHTPRNHQVPQQPPSSRTQQLQLSTKPPHPFLVSPPRTTRTSLSSTSRFLPLRLDLHDYPSVTFPSSRASRLSRQSPSSNRRLDNLPRATSDNLHGPRVPNELKRSTAVEYSGRVWHDWVVKSVEMPCECFLSCTCSQPALLCSRRSWCRKLSKAAGPWLKCDAGFRGLDEILLLETSIITDWSLLNPGRLDSADQST